MSGLSLQKGESLSLTKADGTALTHVRLGLGWDAVKRGWFGGGGDIDLDASAILFDGKGKVVDTVWYGQLKSRDGALRHTGDNLTGDGDGDDEQIILSLSQVNNKVEQIVFVITSYSGQKFDKIKNVFARVNDLSVAGEPEVTRYDLAEQGNHTGLVVAKVYRNGNGWAIKAIGNAANGRTVNDVVKDAKAVL